MLVLSFVLIVSFVLIGNKAQASTEKLDKVKLSSSIARTIDEDGIDYFQLELKKSHSLKFAIKDAKNKKLQLMVVSGLNIDLFNRMLKEEQEGTDSTVTEKELEAYLDDFKIELAIDNLTGEESVGKSKAEIGLRKGNYIVIVMSDSNLKKYGKNYSVSITNSSNKKIERESNDSFKYAMPIKRGQTYQASFFTIFDDVDFFKVTVPEKGQVVVKSTVKKDEKMKFSLYNTNKKKIKTIVKKSGKTYTMQAPVTKGTYYIRVSSDAFILDDAYLHYNVKTYVKTKVPTTTVTNKKGNKHDSMTITGLQKGAKVIVYKDAKKKTVLLSRTASSSKMVIKTKHLKDRGGKLFLTSKNRHLYTSSLKTISYKAAR